jgi:mRNA interferase MazF
VLAATRGSVFMPATAIGLHKNAVVNVTAPVTLDKSDLTDRAGTAPPSLFDEVGRDLRHVLDL